MLLHLTDFKGEIPRVADRLLPQGHAVQALNAKLFSGEIRGWPGRRFVKQPSKASSGTIKTIFLYDDSFWFNWTEDVDVALSPVFEDTLGRVYWTGDGDYPKKGSSSRSATDEDADLPENSFQLGVPAPGAAPDTADNGNGGGFPEDRVYVYTYVTGWGEEGAPSPPADSLEVEASETVTIDNFESAPAAKYNVTHRRIYRTLSGEEATTYQFVAEIAMATTSHDDSLTGEELGEVIPTIGWDEPPTDLEGLVALANGIMAGFSGNSVYFAEPYQPHAWPESYALTTEHAVVGLGALANGVVVMTEGDTYVIFGNHPSEMEMQTVAREQPCVSKRSIASDASAVVYASPNGLFQVGTGGAQLITEPFFERTDWQALNPGGLHGYLHRGRYFGFFDNPSDDEHSGIILDPTDSHNAVVYLGFVATAGMVHHADNALYLVVDQDIVQWDSVTDDPLTYTWRAKWVSNRPMNFAAASVQADYTSILAGEDLSSFEADADAIEAANDAVFADGGLYAAMGNHELNVLSLNGDGYQDPPSLPQSALAFRLYADGELKHTEFLSGDEGFRLPGGFRARTFEVELEGDAPVEQIMLATSMRELTQQ